jgi:hypothetical protein
LAFEQDLVKRLAVLSEALASSALDPDEDVAAFDKAAWAEWDEAQNSVGVVFSRVGLVHLPDSYNDTVNVALHKKAFTCALCSAVCSPQQWLGRFLPKPGGASASPFL